MRLDQFERDCQRDGSGLRMKFCAVHSSAALVVNCFAPFKDRPEDLFLLDQQGAVGIQFEKQMQIIPGRRPSILDVWVDRGSSAVAIRSAFGTDRNTNRTGRTHQARQGSEPATTRRNKKSYELKQLGHVQVSVKLQHARSPTPLGV
ncbi:MAG: hypothetical protein ACYDBH_21505 [Acidobacteriaceae bacterium]